MSDDLNNSTKVVDAVNLIPPPGPFFWAPGKSVAVAPFPPTTKETIRGGVIDPMDKTVLVPLTVVVDSDGGFTRGSVVYVRAALSKTQYAKEVFTAEGVTFILIPQTEVVLVRESP